MVKVYMGIPSMGNRADGQVYALRRIAERYKDKIELVYPEMCVHRSFHDYARNAIVEEFLATDCDMLWFLDSDVIPPENVLDLITEHGDNWKCAGAPYPVFITPSGYDCPQIVFTTYSRDESGMRATHVPLAPGAPMWVDGVATGCIFVRREVFAAMQKPYFEFHYRKEDMHIEYGEDLSFCRKVSDLGYRFLVDFSMVCRHLKSVDLLDVSNYAMGMVNGALVAQDRMIREALTKKMLAKASRSEILTPERKIILAP